LNIKFIINKTNQNNINKIKEQYAKNPHIYPILILFILLSSIVKYRTELHTYSIVITGEQVGTTGVGTTIILF